MSALVAAFAKSMRASWGLFMRDVMAHCTDVERAMHSVASAGQLSYEARSRLRGRVFYLLAQAEMRRREIDIEAEIAREILAEPLTTYPDQDSTTPLG